MALMVNTSRLFRGLLGTLRVDMVCDVGSMDGTDALAFAVAAPGSRVFAFEPNPHNLRRMQANPAFRDLGVRLVPFAASDRNGTADFFVVAADYSGGDVRRGMSSLHPRTGEWRAEEVISVSTTRLDTFLERNGGNASRVALWIDAEGKSFEVIDGLQGAAPHVRLLHVEVESSACIGASQRLYPDVKALLNQLGFRELATDAPTDRDQFNTVWVRGDLSAGEWLRVGTRLLLCWLRRRAGALIGRKG
ncbi:MAG TPA: FkbM family methyltransferase [Steroidobacteraceae bacterium]|nr:FkbM family methyltransferase [Steroidobacteraceae bacterium]